MILTYELDLDWVELNRPAEYLGQRSFRSKVVSTQTHTQGTSRTTRTTKVVDNKHPIPNFRDAFQGLTEGV